jgi:demethylmenaquinone methyltransferase / 2-methoxy-6-polyprenyl-1,4-benzoquinol methylase
VSLRTEIATPQGKRLYVRRLFATIADRYDLITVVLSYGRDRGWKRRLTELANVRGGERALDLACGTGDIAFELADRGAHVVGLDITERMIQLARNRSRQRARFVVGDMLALPFPSASFDLITTGYGIRNVPDIQAALAEIHRVLRPGGRLLSLDFNRPSNPIVRAAYLVYLTLVGSTLGFILHRDPDTYRYIPESIRRYPGADGVRALMRDMGFGGAEWIPVLGGLMAINVGRKRSASAG